MELALKKYQEARQLVIKARQEYYDKFNKYKRVKDANKGVPNHRNKEWN